MLWDATRRGAGAEILDRTIVVEADNWYLALRKYLKRDGTRDGLITNITVTVRPGGAVEVTDSVTQKRFTLVPHIGPEGATQGEPAALSCALAFEREEPPAQTPGIRYIERHYHAPAPLPRQDAESLILAKFFEIHSAGSTANEKLFVNLQLFEESEDADSRSLRTTLIWREWQDDTPQPRFREDETDSKVAVLSSSAKNISNGEAAHPNDSERRVLTWGAARGIDELVITAFERMQEIYTIRDHRAAATFALSLCKELSECSGGLCLLERSGAAPAELHREDNTSPHAEPIPAPPEADSLSRGLLGFATRNSAAIHIVDPQNDPRCGDSLELIGTEPPSNVLCIPLQHEGHTTGALLLWDAPSEVGFSPEDINALAYVAGALAEHIFVSLPARDGQYFADDAPPRRDSEIPKRISLIPLPFLGKRPSNK